MRPADPGMQQKCCPKTQDRTHFPVTEGGCCCLEGGAPGPFIETDVSWGPAALQECPGSFFLKATPQGPSEGPCVVGGLAWFLWPVVLLWGARSGGGWAVHGGQEVNDLGPLSRAEELAHVYYAVHSHLRVFLNQAAEDRREGLGSFLPLSSMGPRVAPRIPVQCLSHSWGPTTQSSRISCCGHLIGDSPVGQEGIWLGDQKA